jgi:hypothetical protein
MLELYKQVEVEGPLRVDFSAIMDQKAELVAIEEAVAEATTRWDDTQRAKLEAANAQASRKAKKVAVNPSCRVLAAYHVQPAPSCLVKLEIPQWAARLDACLEIIATHMASIKATKFPDRLKNKMCILNLRKKPPTDIKGCHRVLSNAASALKAIDATMEVFDGELWEVSDKCHSRIAECTTAIEHRDRLMAESESLEE